MNHWNGYCVPKQNSHTDPSFLTSQKEINMLWFFSPMESSLFLFATA